MNRFSHHHHFETDGASPPRCVMPDCPGLYYPAIEPEREPIERSHLLLVALACFALAIVLAAIWYRAL